MTDDIAALTLKLAQDPTSLAFLPLAEALRRRGQLEAALTVVARGAIRYPEMADGHDLLARIHADQGNGDAAFDSWTTVVRLVPDHLGAHKGLAFLAYRSGDLGRSVKHLTTALELAPHDTTLASAIERIRTVMASRAAATEAAPTPEPETPQRSAVDATPTLLFDQQGRVLRGRLDRVDGVDASEAVAAALAGVSREAERAAKLLEIGEWKAVAIESGAVNFELRSPSSETLLLVMRGREVPAGRLARIADKAVEQARRWLEELA